MQGYSIDRYSSNPKFDAPGHLSVHRGVYLKRTATQHVAQSPLQTHQTATQRAPMIMGGLRHHQLVVERDSGPLERLAGCI